MTPVAPQALALLVRACEGGGSRLVEDAFEGAEREAFRALCECGALKTAPDIAALLCPWCGEHDVDEPRRIDGILQARCQACGYVPITNAALKAWHFDAAWLLAQLRTALGLAGRQDSQDLVPGTLWKVGDWRDGRRARRVLLAHRLADHVVNQAFREALSNHVERDNAVIIGTTSRAAAMLGDLSLPYVHLAELVRLRSRKLELDEARWAWCLKPAHLRGHEASTIFFDNFRLAVIDGEEYAFSARQAAVFECLHAAKGRKCYKDSIMVEIGSPQKNPPELFRHNEEQLEAFARLVAWDDFGFYWLKPR